MHYCLQSIGPNVVWWLHFGQRTTFSSNEYSPEIHIFHVDQYKSSRTNFKSWTSIALIYWNRGRNSLPCLLDYRRCMTLILLYTLLFIIIYQICIIWKTKHSEIIAVLCRLVGYNKEQFSSQTAQWDEMCSATSDKHKLLRWSVFDSEFMQVSQD